MLNPEIENQLRKFFANRITGSVTLLGFAVGGVVSVAVGFYLTFRLVTFLGN